MKGAGPTCCSFTLPAPSICTWRAGAAAGRGGDSLRARSRRAAHLPHQRAAVLVPQLFSAGPSPHKHPIQAQAAASPAHPAPAAQGGRPLQGARGLGILVCCRGRPAARPCCRRRRRALHGCSGRVVVPLRSWGVQRAAGLTGADHCTVCPQHHLQQGPHGAGGLSSQGAPSSVWPQPWRCCLGGAGARCSRFPLPAAQPFPPIAACAARPTLPGARLCRPFWIFSASLLITAGTVSSSSSLPPLPAPPLPSSPSTTCCRGSGAAATGRGASGRRGAGSAAAAGGAALGGAAGRSGSSNRGTGGSCRGRGCAAAGATSPAVRAAAWACACHSAGAAALLYGLS